MIDAKMVAVGLILLFFATLVLTILHMQSQFNELCCVACEMLNAEYSTGLFSSSCTCIQTAFSNPIF
jgi:hypothetical protein